MVFRKLCFFGIFIGVYVEEVLNKWKGDYEKLEHNHTYIQWLVSFMLFNFFLVNWLKPFQFQKNLYICFECRLFPLREQGLNFYAKELTTCEIEVKHLIHNVMLILNHLN